MFKLNITFTKASGLRLITNIGKRNIMNKDNVAINLDT